ncbi:hypothetical protein AMAG_11152 [Allomyces macrogynus ATCC 38327]|uniref:P-loop containing nucleoside triphosphate hydrolase protein n=1 Tax=Allomyces macrogynus (strain ATCC 38327) TaxID=578462 RepID=A0A0L0ST78_ALLM3|nr:hypothetical protein AMAG_11152 [Allomyces macrogynus ATCC 38327]|eukprot:KNE65539.1 hypothetical protein AMAG_11152 [Allomyces macrogynus ATCC 38327]
MTALDDIKQPLQPKPEAATKSRARGFRVGDVAFFQAAPLVAKGYRQGQLEHEDLLPITDADEAEVLAGKLCAHWRAQLETNRAPAMWRVLMTVFGPQYLLVSSLALGAGACRIASAIFLGQFIAFLQTPDAPLERGIGFGVGLALAMILFSIFESHFMMNAYRVGIRARVAVTSFLYSHLLTLNGATLPPVGQTLNVISNDAQRLEDATPYLIFVVLGPLETVVVVGITWAHLGWATAAAFGTLIALLALLSTNVGRFNAIRTVMVDARDQRLRFLSELIRSIEMIKLYAWESAFVKPILEARRAEVEHMQRWYNLKGVNSSFHLVAPSTMAMAGFLTWFFGLGNTFTSQGVFTSLLLFGAVKVSMSWRMPRAFELLADLRVSFQRIEGFLDLKATAAVTPLTTADSDANTVLAFNSATFSWKPDQPILCDVDLKIRAGQFVAVVGQVGSGKSSLLLAALGQLHSSTEGAVRRVTDASYTPQAAYVFPGTVEDNIVMASPVDADRLARVVAVCQLKPDIARWDNGLQTRLGERGAKVSGGQRARLCLARALYHADATRARLVALDDVFAALDAHVAATIFIELRDFFKASDAGVVIVTHNLHLVAQCDEVVYLQSGSVLAHGPLEQVVAVARERDPHFAAVVAEFSNDLAGSDANGDKSEMETHHGLSGVASSVAQSSTLAEDDGESADGESNDEEWEEQSQQGFDATLLWRFLTLGRGGAGLMIGAILTGITTCALQALADYQLSAWAAAPAEQQHATRYWIAYLAFTAVIPLVAIVCTYCFFTAMLRSSTRLFEDMLHNVTRATPYFFQFNPAGRILNRMGKDMALTDETLPEAFTEVMRLWMFVVMVVVLVTLAVPWILLALVPVVVGFFLLRRRYVAANRPVRRLEALSRSPVYAHVVSTVEGIATVTALRREPAYVQQFYDALDSNSRALLSFYTVERWLCLRVDGLACVMIAATIGLMIGLKSQIGFTLAALAQMYVLNLVDATQYGVRRTAELELQLIAVERIMEYASAIPLEAEAVDQVPLPKMWPDQGVVEFRDMTLRYPGADRAALRGITLATRPGEKIGIVGRTGAGKSSIINTLFRLAEPSQDGVHIDGVNISGIDLRDLRGRLAIIPQSLYLFHGSVRFNLDPFGQHSDQALWRALEAVELKDVVERYPAKLDDRPALSAGEGQLFQLARVLLRKSKVLILDECSSNIDVAKDRILQQTIRREFADCTILTIAHRIDTILDNDRVLVLDQGQVAEFDSPHNLLRDRNSMFYGLAAKSLGEEKLESLVREMRINE